jgi:hypothetical protein
MVAHQGDLERVLQQGPCKLNRLPTRVLGDLSLDDQGHSVTLALRCIGPSVAGHSGNIGH